MLRLSAMLLTIFAAGVGAEEVGSVDTAFVPVGPDHKVVVEVFDDPSVQGGVGAPEPIHALAGESSMQLKKQFRERP